MASTRFYVTCLEDWLDEDHDDRARFEEFIDTLSDLSLGIEFDDDATHVAECWETSDIFEGRFFAVLAPPDWNNGTTYLIVSTRAPPSGNVYMELEPTGNELTKDGLPVWYQRYNATMGFYEAYIGKTELWRVDETDMNLDEDDVDEETREAATYAAETRQAYMRHVGLAAKYRKLCFEIRTGVCLVDRDSKAHPDADWFRRGIPLMWRTAINARRRRATLARSRKRGRKRDRGGRGRGPPSDAKRILFELD